MISLIGIIYFVSSVFADTQIEITEYGRKTVTNMGVSISAKEVEHCSAKPDGENDGYKVCEAIIEGYNPNDYELTVDVFNFDLDKDAIVKNKKYDYYFSDTFEYYEETILNESCSDTIMVYSPSCLINVTRKRFYDWVYLGDKVKTTYSDRDFAYKVVFEFPQYEGAFYNFGISYKKDGGEEIPILLDPDISACQSLDVEGETYTLTQDISNETGFVPCMTIDADSITFDLGGHTIDGDKDQFGSVGIKVTADNDDVIIKNGQLKDFKSCISLQSDNTTVRNMSFNYTSTNGMECSICTNFLVENNTFLDVNIAFAVHTRSVGGIFRNNSITNCLSSSTGSGCFNIIRSSGLLFENNQIKNSNCGGIVITSMDPGVADNNLFRNMNFTNIALTTISINDDGLSAINNTFLNVTYKNESVESYSQLIRKWYFSPQVNYTHNASAGSGATITGWNVTDDEIFTDTTDANGQITTQELIEYINNGGTKTFYTNYTINVSLTNWDTDSQEINLTTNYLFHQFNISDTTAPTSTALATSPPDSDGYTFNTWTDENVKVTITASDLGSGVDVLTYPKYCLDDADTCTPNTWINAGVTISTEGVSYIRYFSEDKASNTEATKTQTIKIDSITPAVSLLTETPSDPQTYSSGVTYEFNATITDANLEDVLFEFDETNYTPSSSGDVYNWTVVDLSAGVYNYRWFANDTLGHTNNTETGSYTINKASASTSLTYDVASPQDYGTPITPTCSVVVGVGSAVLKMDGNVITSGNPITLGADTYSFNCSLVESENYTTGSDSSDYTISKIDPSSNMEITGTASVEYPTVSDFSESETNTGDGGCSYSMDLSNRIYGVGESPVTFNYSTTGCDNYTDGSVTKDLTITQNISLVVGLAATTPIEYPTITNFVGSGCPDELTCTLNLTNAIFGAGIRIANYSTPGNENYTAESTTFSVTINPNSTLVLGITGTSPITYGTITDVAGDYCPAELSCDLDIANAVYGVDVSPVTFNYSTAGNNNYSSESVTIAITINQAILEGNLTSDLGWTINETQSVTIGLETANAGDDDVDYNVSRGGVDTGTGETWSPAFGTYDYVLNTTGGANWTANASMDTETLTVLDNINPDISIVYPTNNSNHSINTIEINFTRSDTNLDSCWYSNDTYDVNKTLIDCANVTGITWAEGNHNVTIWVNDSGGNVNLSSVSFFIDTINPTLSIIHPADFQSFTTGTVDLNYTVSDSGIGLETCWYRNNTDASNVTIACGTNTSISQGADGNYIVYMWANDSLGNEVSDSHTWTVSTDAPSVTLKKPDDDKIFDSGANIWFNYTSADGDGIDTCQLWGNWTGTWHKNKTTLHGGDTSVDVDEGNFTIPLIADGYYKWNVWCNDSATPNKESWATNNRTFLIDSTSPVIDYDVQTPLNDTNSTSTSLYVNITWTEINLDSIKFTLYNSIGSYNITTFTTATYDINWTNLPDDIYYYNVTIEDTAGNTDETETRLIRLDDTAPTITIDHPKAQNYADNDTVYLNYSAVDNVVGLNKCWYYVHNSTGDTIIATTTLATCQNTTFQLPGGDIDYTVYLFAQDLLLNTNTESVTFGIRTISPAIALSPINDTHSDSLTNNYFNFTVTTNSDSIDTCELWGDFNTTWHKNQTMTTVIYDGTKNNFTALDLVEGSYEWNVWCNDSVNNEGWGLNNQTYVTDITNPNINLTTITTTAGTQTFRFNTTVSDTNLKSCKYSIFDSTGAIDGINVDIPFVCNVETPATTTAFGNFNLTTYAEDKAGNENLSSRNFTTSPSAIIISGGGGGVVTVITESILATNFSVTTTNLLKEMDHILSKDSVRPRRKNFIVTNRAKDPITVEIACGFVEGEIVNETDICDYVKFYDLEGNEIDSVIVLAHEENVAELVMEISTPPNSSFEDEHFFNVLGIRYLPDGSSTYSKLSVTSRVTPLGILYKWAYLPLQEDKPMEDWVMYPVIGVSVAVAFVLFLLTFLILRWGKFYILGFFLGITIFIASFIALMIIL